MKTTMIMTTANPDGSSAYVYEDGDTVIEDQGFDLFESGVNVGPRGRTLVDSIDRGDAPEPDCPVTVLTWFPKGMEFDAEIEAAKAALVGLEDNREEDAR